MPKQSLKLKVAKACAIACIVGMSGNTFVVAGKSIAIKSETAAVARTDFSPSRSRRRPQILLRRRIRRGSPTKAAATALRASWASRST